PVPGRVMVVTTVSELADAGVGPAVVRSHHLEPGPYGAGGTADLVLGDTDRPAQPGQTRRSEVTDLPASQSQPSLPGGSEEDAGEEQPTQALPCDPVGDRIVDERSASVNEPCEGGRVLPVFGRPDRGVVLGVGAQGGQ